MLKIQVRIFFACYQVVNKLILAELLTFSCRESEKDKG